MGSRCPFRHKARSPRVRTHSFTAQPPDIRYVALATRASRLLARSPCLAAPPIRFLFIGSRFTLHASFPRLVTLPQLRFASFAVASLREDLHLQECARAGRTKKASTKLALAIKLRLLVRHVSSFRLLLSSAFHFTSHYDTAKVTLTCPVRNYRANSHRYYLLDTACSAPERRLLVFQPNQ